jgi:C1A family cysteine protease
MKKEVVYLSLIILTVLALFGALAHNASPNAVASMGLSAESPASISLAPLNPLFIQYQQDLVSSRGITQTDQHHIHGSIPPPVNLSHLTGQYIPIAYRGYPPVYDLRAQGKVASIKDQGTC